MKAINSALNIQSFIDRDIDYLGVTNGYESFTGIRIWLTARGILFW